jgi:hypothetical protein
MKISQQARADALTALVVLALSACAHTTPEIRMVDQYPPKKSTAELDAGASPEAVATAAGDHVPVEELRFSVLGTRLANVLHWQIDSSGKGKISAPTSVGYEPVVRLVSDPVYKIAPGVHSFDIGEDGYHRLRAFLALVIDVKRDPNETFQNGNLRCVVERSDDSGSLQIVWTGERAGMISLPNECLNGLGQTYQSRMLQSWHILAEQMRKKGHPAISIADQPTLAAPKMLAMTEKAIRTPDVTSWQINGNGKGWIEFMRDGSVQSADPFQSYFVYAGRYHFQLDHQFHQAVLRELAPYLDASSKPVWCEDEIFRGDQPMVKVSWVDINGDESAYNSDFGCPSFASRLGRIRMIFNELVGSGRVGNSMLLTSTKKIRADAG